MKKKGLFIASTGQHVGKTTTCLGLVSGLKKRFKSVGFLKPVGQEHLLTNEGVVVDKDVILFKDYFSLLDPYEMMSPIVFSKGFTKDYLDGEIDRSALIESLKVCYEHLKEHNEFIIAEGTGHVGVGSIVDLNNAQVAAILNLDMILIVSGGIGSCFDSIALNYALCESYGVKIKGVILNKVLSEKKQMIVEYMEKALRRWDIPLIGAIPFDLFLTNPTIDDYVNLFKEPLISGENYKIRHFTHTRLIATSLEVYKTLICPSQLIITPASREDIILETIKREFEMAEKNETLSAGIILTGILPPKPSVIEQLKSSNIPCFYTPTNTFNAMKMITSYTSKLKKEDTARVEEAISLVEGHIDFDRLMSL
jgi:dethiobiotin synthase